MDSAEGRGLPLDAGSSQVSKNHLCTSQADFRRQQAHVCMLALIPGLPGSSCNGNHTAASSSRPGIPVCLGGIPSPPVPQEDVREEQGLWPGQDT